MSLHSLTIQPVKGKQVQAPFVHQLPISLLAMLAFSLRTIQKSKKDFNRMKRRFLWTSFKIRLRNFLKEFTGR